LVFTGNVKRDVEFLEEIGRRLDGSYKKYAELLLFIRDKAGQRVALRANAAQQAFERTCSGRDLVLKARQLGITTWVTARFFLATITRRGTLSVQVAHDQSAAEAIFRIVHRFLENLPEVARTGALQTSRANVRQLVFPHFDSEYRVEWAGDSEAGRGLTIHNLHCSEVARWPRDPAATLASLRAALTPRGHVVLESTPNGAGGCFYDEWQRAPETSYTRHFHPWWLETGYRVEGPALVLDDEERTLARHEGLSNEQIAFRRQLRSRFGALAAQEFAEDAESCFLASEECVFDVALVTAALANCPEPAESRDNGRLLVWLPPQTGARYVMGVDPAGGGSSGDYAVAQVIDGGSGMQCAELRGHLPPRELAARVAELGREYNRAFVAVERNNHGHAVIAHLEAERYTELYEQGGKAGWLTSAASRPVMLESFATVLAKQRELFSSRRLLTECRSFVRRPDGSAAAAPGAHDDCIMAMAIAQAVRTEGQRRPRWPLRFGSLSRV
jgi:hypothetical protein